MLLKEDIIEQVPYFKDMIKKEKFIAVIGALTARLISLGKASEILEVKRETLIEMLDNIGVEFSYLDYTDIEIERNFKDNHG
jgi:predicted HTH domain antitoxin